MIFESFLKLLIISSFDTLVPVKWIVWNTKSMQKRNSTESREVDRKDGADLLEKVLIPIYEPKFSDGSYGYRPHRSAKDAILKVKEYADAVAASLQGEVITKLAKDGFVQTVALLQRIIWTILCFSHGSNLF